MRSAAKYVWIIVFITFVGGFLLLDTSGLLGTDALTPSTRVAKVNGRDILYGEWTQRLQNASQQQADQIGRPLNLDESRELETRILEEMIMEILLEEEYRRRGITASEEEIIHAADAIPHPDLIRSPELQTEGRFDPEKYHRWLQSPSTRAAGWLIFLESYYRAEIPRRKLLEQVVSDVHITDAEMWSKWRDVHDSAQVSFIAITPETHVDSIPVVVTEDEIRRHYDDNQDLYRQSGRATVSVVHLPRILTGADTIAARERVATLRSEILAGDDTAFAAVARRESDDARTSVNGGLLNKGVRGQFYGPSFDTAAFALSNGQVSQPVLTPFGYHLIQLVDRNQDTVTLRHLLAEIRPGDSAAVALDRRADSLSSFAAESQDPTQLDKAANLLGIPVRQALVFGGQPLVLEGRYVPSASAWAFSGARPGETSQLFDADEGFYLARLDSLIEEGVAPLSESTDVIRMLLERKKKLDALYPVADGIARRAASGTLEAAAAEAGASVQKTEMFSRLSFVAGIGRDNEAIGAAFALPTGAISTPVTTEDAVFVLRLDRRVNADRDAWLLQRDLQRQLLMQSMQQERVQAFLRGLREKATVVDERKKLNEIGRELQTLQASQPAR
jgi:peptidyl-prolyl cis-trans isomerase D